MTRVLRNRLVVTAALALGVLLAAEAGLRAIDSDVLPEPPEYASDMVRDKIRQMERYRVAGLSGGIVVTGTSQANRLDPRPLVEAGLADHAYNSAIPDGSPPFQQRWLLEEVVPRLAPKTVVWVVSGTDFDDTTEDLAAAHAASRATKRGVLGDLDRWVSDRSVLFHYRPLFNGIHRTIETLSELGEDDAEQNLAPGLLGERGQRIGTLPWPLDEHIIDTYHELLAAQPVQVRQINAPRWGNEDEMRDTIHALRRLGIDVYLAEHPTSDLVRELIPDGAEFIGESRARIQRVARETGATYIDLATGHTAIEGFADRAHLSLEEARRVSRRLTEALGGTLPDPPPTTTAAGPSGLIEGVHRVGVRELSIEVDPEVATARNYVMHVTFGSQQADHRIAVRANQQGRVAVLERFDGDGWVYDRSIPYWFTERHHVEVELPAEVISGEVVWLFVTVHASDPDLRSITPFYRYADLSPGALRVTAPPRVRAEGSESVLRPVHTGPTLTREGDTVQWRVPFDAGFRDPDATIVEDAIESRQGRWVYDADAQVAIGPDGSTRPAETRDGHVLVEFDVEVLGDRAGPVRTVRVGEHEFVVDGADLLLEPIRP